MSLFDGYAQYIGVLDNGLYIFRTKKELDEFIAVNEYAKPITYIQDWEYTAIKGLTGWARRKIK